MTDSGASTLPKLSRSGHASHCVRCLQGLPDSMSEIDPSRMAIGFYGLGSLDILGLLESKTAQADREAWVAWIWAQQSKGPFGTGFKGSPYMTPDLGVDSAQQEYTEYSTPNLIMSYTAILSLAILRDDFSRLDREGLVQFVRSCQCEDGSFAPLPNGGEADLRSVYCAFAISSMLDDWGGVDIPRSVAYIQSCASYEGGFGQTPAAEAIGGTTYCALASLSMLPPASSSPPPSTTTTTSTPEWISKDQRTSTIRWLLQNQTPTGGFSGRTNKLGDACYCFWCSASLELLGAAHLVDHTALAHFLARCQFKFGGLGKAPGARPDPYHTYMSLAALCICPPLPLPISPSTSGEGRGEGGEEEKSWTLPRLHVQWNVTRETAGWVERYVPLRAGGRKG